jgi:hypothetical protein
LHAHARIFRFNSSRYKRLCLRAPVLLTVDLRELNARIAVRAMCVVGSRPMTAAVNSKIWHMNDLHRSRGLLTFSADKLILFLKGFTTSRADGRRLGS